MAFVWTCALELPVYTLLVGRRFRSWWTIVVVALAANALTHPALWFLVPRFDPPAVWFLSAEAGVVVLEAAWLALALSLSRQPKGAVPMAATTALAANGLSAGAGLLCAWYG